MRHAPADPFASGGLEQFAKDFREGKITALDATQAYLARIDILDPHLKAYQTVNAEQALASAKAMDALFAAGTDLGPLMGVPVAVKDIFTIGGYPPPTAGSKIDLAAIAGPDEGAFINALRRCGAVILGATKAVELCLGITGVSAPHGTPWNPWDLQNQRVPGGSSSGSGVACAAGLCAFAIGSDSGGSVRVPAAYNGIFGIKTTFGRWPTDGSVPLDPSVDSIGLLTRTARDAQIVFNAIETQLFGQQHQGVNVPARLRGVAVGIPGTYFYDDLDDDVRLAVEKANESLRGAGCSIESIDVTEAAEREGYFPLSMPASLVAMLGKDILAAAKPKMDPIVAVRVESGLDVKASDLLAAGLRRQQSIQQARRYFDDVDVIATPTTVTVSPKLTEFDNPQRAMKNALGMTRNTQPSNYLGQCAVSLPLPRRADQLPIGYQLIGAPDSDVRLLSIAVAIERLFGKGAAPDLSKFGG